MSLSDRRGQSGILDGEQSVIGYQRQAASHGESPHSPGTHPERADEIPTGSYPVLCAWCLKLGRETVGQSYERRALAWHLSAVLSAGARGANQSKKAFKKAVQAGARPETYNFSGMFPAKQNGQDMIEGPHYPKPHRWYASVQVVNGRVVKVLG